MTFVSHVVQPYMRANLIFLALQYSCMHTYNVPIPLNGDIAG